MWNKHKDFIDFKEKDVIESFQAEEIQRSIKWQINLHKNHIVKDN